MKSANERINKVYGKLFGKAVILILAAALIVTSLPAVYALVSEAFEASPTVHSAVAEFLLPEEGENKEQTGDFWRYQYALDSETPDWQACTRVHGDYWRPATSKSLAYMGVSKLGKMQIRNFNGHLNKVGTPSVSYAFLCDRGGRITMDGSAMLISASDGYSARVRITVNGSAVYPAEGWLAVGSDTDAVFDGVTFNVSNGDVIRFEMSVSSHLESGCELFVNWNPSFLLTEDGSEYTETNDIFNRLTAFMSGIFRSAASETLDLNAASDISAAKAIAEKGQLGLYTPLNAVYSGSRLLPSGTDSVWKFAVLTGCNDELYTPNGNLGLSAQWSASGLSLSWSGESNLSELCLVLNDGSVKKYTVSNNSVILPLTADLCPIKVQVITENIFSEVLTVYSDTDKNTAMVEEELIYLNSVSSFNSSKPYAYFKLSDSAVSSYYSFYYSTGDYSTRNTDLSNFRKREILFFTAPNEKMRFGFTAQIDGEYEISAPLAVATAGAGVKYSVLRQSTDGTVTALQASRAYSGEEIFCNLRTRLSKGETVWLEASSSEAAEISIGIPHFNLNAVSVGSDGTVSAVYRAADYMESTYKNSNFTYSNASSTENSRSAWSFGYFKNTVASDNYDPLGLSDSAVGDNTNALDSLLTPYELIRHNIYNALPVSETAESNSLPVVTGTYGVVGNLYTALGNTYADRQKLGNHSRCRGLFGCTGSVIYKPSGEKLNIGIYMKYSAQTCGNAVLHLSDGADIKQDKLLIAKNGSLLAVYGGTVKKGTVVDLGYLEAGDTVTLYYAKLSDGKSYGYIGMPYVVTQENQVSVILKNSADEPPAEIKAQIGTQITLSAAKEKAGQLFLGWYDSENNSLIPPTEKLSVSVAANLTARYAYYGDLNTDGNITAVDLGMLKKSLLGQSAGLYENKDVNADGSLDILDLVRMKKWLSGVPCFIGK